MWMRASVLVLHMLGTFKELVKLGYMTADVDPLPPGHPGSDPKWAEFGLNFTQGRWVEGALDYVKFGDERDVTLQYDPRIGGRGVKLFKKTASIQQADGSVDVVGLQRIEASLKPLVKMTQFGGLTGSGKTLPEAYYFKADSDESPNVFVPECQLFRGSQERRARCIP
jgi:hypothetical protein